MYSTRVVQAVDVMLIGHLELPRSRQKGKVFVQFLCTKYFSPHGEMDIYCFQLSKIRLRKNCINQSPPFPLVTLLWVPARVKSLQVNGQMSQREPAMFTLRVRTLQERREKGLDRRNGSVDIRLP